jgi:hypothetical protein
MFGNAYFGGRYFSDAYYGHGYTPGAVLGRNPLKYWFNGVPLQDVPYSTDERTVKFWNNGVPLVVMYPTAGAGGVTYYPIQFLMGL